MGGQKNSFDGRTDKLVQDLGNKPDEQKRNKKQQNGNPAGPAHVGGGGSFFQLLSIEKGPIGAQHVDGRNDDTPERDDRCPLEPADAGTADLEGSEENGNLGGEVCKAGKARRSKSRKSKEETQFGKMLGHSAKLIEVNCAKAFVDPSAKREEERD